MGVMSDGQRAVSTGTLNVTGRMGSTNSEIYIVNAAAVAAAAIEGCITDPRKYIKSDMTLENLHGRVAWLFDQIDFDVDQIVGVKNIKIKDPDELARLAMANYEADFASKISLEIFLLEILILVMGIHITHQ